MTRTLNAPASKVGRWGGLSTKNARRKKTGRVSKKNLALWVGASALVRKIKQSEKCKRSGACCGKRIDR